MLKIESFYLNNKPFIFKSIFMISKKRRICFYEKENFCIIHGSSDNGNFPERMQSG